MRLMEVRFRSPADATVVNWLVATHYGRSRMTAFPTTKRWRSATLAGVTGM
jgi:hypothetical protein